MTAMLNKLKAHQHYNKLREVFFFGLVGVGATLTHYFAALASVEWASLNVFIANLIGYCTAVLLSFFGHSRLSFQVTMTKSRFTKFVITSVATFCTSQVLLAGLNSMAMSERISLLIVVFSIPVISYLVNKFWVFKM